MSVFIRKAALVLIAIGALGACEEEILGNGELVTESVVTPYFSRVAVSNALLATIRNAPTEVALTMDENLLSLIRIRVVGETLEIDVDGDVSIAPSEGAVIEIASPVIEGVSLSGASAARVESTCAEMRLDASGASRLNANVEADTVVVDLSGSSVATLTGNAPTLVIDASGSSTARSTTTTANADLEASGSSELAVSVTDRVSVRASGASDVRISGNPRHRDVDTSGSSRVRYQ
jgi:hypothetical protein